MNHKSPDIIEQVVSQCREKLDIDYDFSSSWGSIESKLDQRQKTKTTRSAGIYSIWSRVSAIAAVLVLGIVVGRYMVPSLNAVPSSSPITEIKSHYNQEVNRHITLVKAYEPNHAILDEIRALDEQIDMLEKDYSDATELQKELILESMISNYQSRVYLLENILNKLNTHTHDKFTEI